MSPAKPADPQIPSLIREKTDCTSSPAIPVDLAAVLLLSRLVSLPKSERDADSKVRGHNWFDFMASWCYESFFGRFGMDIMHLSKFAFGAHATRKGIDKILCSSLIIRLE